MTTVDFSEFNPAVFDGFTPVDVCGAQYTVTTVEGFPLTLVCELDAHTDVTPHLATFGWLDPLPDTESTGESEPS